MADNQEGLKNKIIILIGMPGCGKSTIAQKVAVCLGWPWLDSDQEIEKLMGMTVAEIFSRFGETCFRELETQCLKDLLQNRDEGAVISLGGGAVRNFITEDTQEVSKPLLAESLWRNCIFVYLHRTVADILKSVDLKDRPLLKDNPERITELFQERHPLYQRISHVCIGNDGSIEQGVEKVLQAVKDYMIGGKSNEIVGD